MKFGKLVSIPALAAVVLAASLGVWSGSDLKDASASPPVAPVITGDCITVVHEDFSFQTVHWEELGNLDTSRKAINLFVWRKNDGIQRSFRDSYNWNAGFEVISIRLLPNGKMQIRGTTESPGSAKQIVQERGAFGNATFATLPTASRAAAHATAQASFFMVQDSAKIEQSDATFDYGPCD